MDNFKIENADENLKSLNIDINQVSLDDDNKLNFTKNDSESYTASDIKIENSKPNLSSFDRKDIHFGLDLLENPNKKKRNSESDITFSPTSIEKTNVNENSNNLNYNENNSSNNIEIKEFKINDNDNNYDNNNNNNNNNNILNKSDDIINIDGDVNIDDLFKDVSKQDNDIQSFKIDNNVKNEPTINNDDIINNVPIDSFIPRKKTAEDILQEKKEYLFKFERLIEKGYNIPKRFTLASDLEEMTYEYNKIKNSKEIDNSIKFQRQMLMACITGCEWLNNKFDPFDIKLDGWSESVNENINDYDEVFEELHEKYKDKASVPPEIKLLFMLGGSAFMFHLSKTIFKTSLPGMEQIMQQNPELMKQFASAAMNSMSNQNPGFTNFMGNMGGINNQQSNNQQSNNQNPMFNNQNNDANLIHSQPTPEELYKSQTNSFKSRKEMTGPSGVDDILNKLSTKEGNISDLDNNSNAVQGESFNKQINGGISINI